MRPITRFNRLLAVAVASATLVTLAAPAAHAQVSNPNVSTPTTLYFHVFDPFNAFPINTQPMDADFFEVGGTSFPSMRSQGYEFNTVRGYSTPGPVEYDFIENGRPRFHPERGISADVQIDGNVQPVVHLYVEVRDGFGLTALPSALPTFTFETTIREGDNLAGDLDAGAVIMDGALSAHIVDLRACPESVDNETLPVCQAFNDPAAGQTAPDGLPVLVPNADGVVEFVIPMNIQKDVIPKSDAFNVRIDWWQDFHGAMAEEDFSTGFFRFVSDPAHLPRLEMAITNPVYIEFIHPQVAGGVLLIHTGVNSPWGTYDVDADAITMTVTGPSTPQTLERVATLNQHVHNAHDQAAELTWLWRFRDEGAAEGEYTIEMTVPNLAGTATATGQAKFTIEGKRAFGVSDQGEIVEPAAVDDAGNDTPAPGALAFAAAVIASALLARRHGRERA